MPGEVAVCPPPTQEEEAEVRKSQDSNLSYFPRSLSDTRRRGKEGPAGAVDVSAIIPGGGGGGTGEAALGFELLIRPSGL